MAGHEREEIIINAPQYGAAKQGSKINLWAPLGIVLFTALLYSRALPNSFTSFDDDFYILKNPYLRNFSWQGVKDIFTSFYSSNYHPLTTLTYLVEFRLFGLDPLPYHALNVLLHLLNTWLVFFVALRLSGKTLTATVVSVLFAIHPMHVESVAWVAERKDVLYTFFFLSSWLVYLRYLSSGLQARCYIFAFLLFIASLFSKSAAVTLPVVLMLTDIYTGRRISWRLLAEKIPFLALSIVFGILNIMSQSAGGSINHIAASFGFINRVFLFTSALSSYLLRLFVPYHLSGMHYFPVMHNGWLPWYYYLSLPLVALTAWVIIRKSTFRKELLFGTTFFLITIALMLQIVSVGSALISERYTYVSYIGLFYIIGQFISGLDSVRLQKGILSVFCLAVIAYSVQTWQRIGIWKTDMILFNDMIEKNPEVYFGYWMRGNFEKQGGDLPSALDDYSKSIALNPVFEDAYFNRGIIYDAMGNAPAAVKDYSMSIRLNPDSADAHNNRGWAYFQLGDTAAALRDLNNAIILRPAYVVAHNNRGWLHLQSGNLVAALSDFDAALATNPDYSKARYNRTTVKGSMGDYKGVLEDCNYLIAQFPNDGKPFYLRGVTHLLLKDTALACPDFKTAASLGNELAPAAAAQFCNRKY